MATPSEVLLATRGPFEVQYLLGVERWKALHGPTIASYRTRPYLSELDIEENARVQESVPWALRVLRNGSVASIHVVEFWNKKLHKLGMLVKMESCKKKGNVMIYVEQRKELGWCTFEKEAKAFTSLLCELDDFTDDVSIIALGFFPTTFVVDGKLSVRELVDASLGLRFTWEALWEKNKETIWLSRTWEFDHIIPLRQTLQISREMVFVGDRSEFPTKVLKCLKKDGARKNKRKSATLVVDCEQQPNKKQRANPTVQCVEQIAQDLKSTVCGEGENKVTIPGLAADRPDIEISSDSSDSDDSDDSPTVDDMVRTPNMGSVRSILPMAPSIEPVRLNPQKSQIDASLDQPEKSLMEEGPRDQLRFRPKPEGSDDLAKVVAEAEFPYSEIMSKYVLKLSDFVNIPVELLETPGNDLRSRPFDPKRAGELKRLMIQNPLQVLQFADVLPISRELVDDKEVVKILQFKDLTKDEIYQRIPDCFFVTISGQHSSQAMVWLRDDATTTDCLHVKGVAKKHRYRQCRILVGHLPRRDYITLGLMSNPEAGKTMYDTPFVQKVEHIRSLYHYNNCPPRPTPGVPRSPRYLAWEAEAIKLLRGKVKNHTPFGNVQWAIFGSEKVFNLWLEVCHLFTRGLLPERDGVVRPKKKDRVIHLTFFKKLEGDIPEEKIIEIFEDVKEYKVLFTKTKSKSAVGLDIDSINEAATRYKDSTWIQRLLLCKLKADFPDSTCDIKSWSNVVTKCSAVERNFAILVSLLDAKAIKNKKRTPSADLVAESCASALRKLWVEAVPTAVCNVADERDPFHILYIKDKEDCTITSPPTRMKYPSCRLAVVDFTTILAYPWSLSAVSSLVKSVHSIFASRWIQFVFLLSTVDAISMTSVFDFLFKPPASNPYQTEFDHGTFRPHRLPGTDAPLQSCAPVLVIRAFVSTEKEKWGKIITGQMEFNFDVNLNIDTDLVQNFDMRTVQTRLEMENAAVVLQGGVEKTPRKIRREMLQFFPPHHTMCGLPPTGRFGAAFPARVAHEIILRNSNPKEIVIDCFSGGWVSKVALLNDRECAVYTISKSELDFLETYLPLFGDIDAAKSIFRSVGNPVAVTGADNGSAPNSLSAMVCGRQSLVKKRTRSVNMESESTSTQITSATSSHDVEICGGSEQILKQQSETSDIQIGVNSFPASFPARVSSSDSTGKNTSSSAAGSFNEGLPSNKHLDQDGIAVTSRYESPVLGVSMVEDENNLLADTYAALPVIELVDGNVGNVPDGVEHQDAADATEAFCVGQEKPGGLTQHNEVEDQRAPNVTIVDAENGHSNGTTAGGDAGEGSDCQVSGNE